MVDDYFNLPENEKKSPEEFQKGRREADNGKNEIILAKLSLPKSFTDLDLWHIAGAIFQLFKPTFQICQRKSCYHVLPE